MSTSENISDTISINLFPPFFSPPTRSDRNMADLNFFSFDNDSSRHPGMNHSPTFDFTAVSPTMSNPDDVFGNHNNATPIHVNPGSVWDGPTHMFSESNTVNGLGKLLTHYNGPANQAFGQITPPDDDDMHDFGKPPGERADSGVANGVTIAASNSPHILPPKARSSSIGRPSKRARKDSQVSDDDEGPGDGKREKYREKNRVAAAKCRAKKKEHVDHLEENHRAQSALNTALRQTEKTLRDELSFWRTQALQHTFCNCRAIQEYNLQKAQSLASGPGFGRSMHDSKSLPVSSSCGVHGLQSLSASGPAASSPIMGRDSRSVSLASAHSIAPKNMNRGAHGSSPDMLANAGPFLIGGKRDLKDFVNEMPD